MLIQSLGDVAMGVGGQPPRTGSGDGDVEVALIVGYELVGGWQPRTLGTPRSHSRHLAAGDGRAGYAVEHRSGDMEDRRCRGLRGFCILRLCGAGVADPQDRAQDKSYWREKGSKGVGKSHG